MQRPMRYLYRNRAYIASGTAHGLECDPVRRSDGKCIVSSRHQLVRFQDGALCVVVRRCLRLRRKDGQNTPGE